MSSFARIVKSALPIGSSPSHRWRPGAILLVLLLGSASALHAGTVTATWDPNPEPDVTGYLLSYGTVTGQHPNGVPVGNVTTYQLTLPVGQRYYFVVQAYNAAGLYSLPSAEVVTDIVDVATLTFPSNGAANADLSQAMQWTAAASAQAYYIYGGRSLGASDLINSGEVQSTSFLAMGVPGGQTVFARLWTKVAGVWRSTDSTFTTSATAVSVIATLTSPVNGATNVDLSQPIQWTAVPNVQAYYLYGGSALGANDLVNTGEIQQTSYLAAGVPGGQKVFARLWTKVGGVWRSSDSSFTTGATVAAAATLTSPANGATNVDMTLPLQWTTVGNAQAYYLYVGSTLGAKDFVNTGEIQQTSYVATGVPSGQTVFARLWTKVGGVWRSTDSTFSAR